MRKTPQHLCTFLNQIARHRFTFKLCSPQKHALGQTSKFSFQQNQPYFRRYQCYHSVGMNIISQTSPGSLPEWFLQLIASGMYKQTWCMEGNHETVSFVRAKFRGFGFIRIIMKSVKKEEVLRTHSFRINV